MARFGLPGWVLAGAVYLAGAVVMWWHAWSGHPSSAMTCGCGDPSSFVWYLAWPAYAISHGHSLFFTTRVHVPGGMNLLDNTSVLALGVVLAPVTWLFGPIASLNVALTAAPALTALAAYGSLRRALGVSRLAAFAGGLGFGFSPFMLRNEAAVHLQTSFMALLPLIFWCCYELAVAQRGRWWRWGAALGVLIAAQFFVGTDILVIVAITAALALLLTVLAGLRHKGAALRAKWPFAWRGFGVAAVVAGILLSYPLLFSLAGPEHIRGPDYLHTNGNGLLQVLLPLRPLRWMTTAWAAEGYRGPVGAFEGYLGIPALVVLAVAVVVVRRTLTKFCAVMTVIVVWLSLGSTFHPLTQGGEPSWLWLPWRAVASYPVLDKLTPADFSGPATWFVVVAAAVLVDQLVRPGQAGSPAGTRFRLPVMRDPAARAGVAAVVSAALLVPWIASWHVPFRTGTVSSPAWETHAGAHLAAGAVVLFYPFPATGKDRALLWQAEFGMKYAIVGGRGIVAGKNGAADHGWTPGTPEGTMSALTVKSVPHLRLRLPGTSPAEIRWFRQALRRWGVTNVVMIAGGGRDPGYARHWLTSMLGAKPVRENGAWVWKDVRKLA